MKKLNFFASYVSPRADGYIRGVLNSGMLSEGKYVREFEQKLEKHFNLPENSVICTNSGTSALHLALKTLGVRLYDEVILPAQTFIATGLSILYADAAPMFTDINESGLIDVRKIHGTFDTKAVIAVNWAGKACDIQALEELCHKQGWKLIIDAAQSLGVGMGGDITCLSFQATKHLTTGDGGAVVCYNPEDYEKARKLNWFGIDRERDLPDVLGERVYSVDKIGFKYHMNNYAAALGLANLETFDERQEHRKNISYIYQNNLRSAVYNDTVSPYWHFPLRVDDVRKFSEYCQSAGVPVNNLHRGIDQYPVFQSKVELPVQRQWEQHVTHLPIHHEITDEDALWICEQVNKYE